jgi:hypothetical protein
MDWKSRCMLQRDVDVPELPFKSVCGVDCVGSGGMKNQIDGSHDLRYAAAGLGTAASPAEVTCARRRLYWSEA